MSDLTLLRSSTASPSAGANDDEGGRCGSALPVDSGVMPLSGGRSCLASVAVRLWPFVVVIVDGAVVSDRPSGSRPPTVDAVVGESGEPRSKRWATLVFVMGRCGLGAMSGTDVKGPDGSLPTAATAVGACEASGAAAADLASSAAIGASLLSVLSGPAAPPSEDDE
jgi:hypothetical protein